MHPNLFPENHVSRPEGNGSVSFHPLPLPPVSVSPKQTNFSHQSVPKVETPSMAGQWQKRKLIGSGTYGCVYEATNRYDKCICCTIFRFSTFSHTNVQAHWSSLCHERG
jgi:hypothetical protein